MKKAVFWVFKVFFSLHLGVVRFRYGPLLSPLLFWTHEGQAKVISPSKPYPSNPRLLFWGSQNAKNLPFSLSFFSRGLSSSQSNFHHQGFFPSLLGFAMQSSSCIPFLPHPILQPNQPPSREMGGFFSQECGIATPRLSLFSFLFLFSSLFSLSSVGRHKVEQERDPFTDLRRLQQF